jgi:hypothetical protein
LVPVPESTAGRRDPRRDRPAPGSAAGGSSDGRRAPQQDDADEQDGGGDPEVREVVGEGSRGIGVDLVRLQDVVLDRAVVLVGAAGAEEETLPEPTPDAGPVAVPAASRRRHRGGGVAGAEHRHPPPVRRLPGHVAWHGAGCRP